MNSKTKFILIFFFIVNCVLSKNDSISINRIIDNRVIQFEHSEIFSSILTQDNEGRIKPFHTVSSEIIRKIARKRTLYGQTPSQIVLGMIVDPLFWYMVPIIKVNQISSIIGNNNSHVSFASFFDTNNKYLLEEYVQNAYSKKPIDRTKFDKSILDIDERVNICSMIFSDLLIKIFPSDISVENPWSTDVSMNIPSIDSTKTSSFKVIYRELVLTSMLDNDWSDSNILLDYIINYQKQYAIGILPSKTKIDAEILYNKMNPFGWNRLFLAYFLFGFILLNFLFTSIFYDSNFITSCINYIKTGIVFSFLFHLLALVLRWYISGHAPWSNAYESVIFIAFATMLAGFVFTKKSNFALVAACFVTTMLLFVANLNWLNPEITNLVPVLKSYWLMIHVSVITSSYGFFGLCAFIGFLNLFFIIISYNKKIKSHVKTLTVINEQSMIIGLFLLTVGTFLGGVWANESWGRYWGWDPKETWALVSILTYSLILHIRLMKFKKYILYFNTCSLFGFSSILMTYFGVNYYLDGLHSYAAGDAFPIPSFVLPTSIILILLSMLSFFRFNKWLLKYE